jgi:hypothetical protein
VLGTFGFSAASLRFLLALPDAPLPGRRWEACLLVGIQRLSGSSPASRFDAARHWPLTVPGVGWSGSQIAWNVVYLGWKEHSRRELTGFRSLTLLRKLSMSLINHVPSAIGASANATLVRAPGKATHDLVCPNAEQRVQRWGK